MQKKNINADKAEKMYRSGASMADIGRQLNIPAGTIRRWKNTYKWDSKPKANESERKNTKANESERKKAERLKATKDASKAFKEAKERQQKRIASKPPAYTDPELLAWRLSEYIYMQYQEEKPILVNGLYRAAGIDDVTWLDYASGKRDHITSEIVDQEGRHMESREGREAVASHIREYRERQELIPYFSYLTTGTASNTLQEPITDTYSSHSTHYSADSTLYTYSSVCKNARLLLNESVEERLINGRLGDVVRANNILGWAQEKREIHRMEIATEDDAKKALEELKLLDD